MHAQRGDRPRDHDPYLRKPPVSFWPFFQPIFQTRNPQAQSRAISGREHQPLGRDKRFQEREVRCVALRKSSRRRGGKRKSTDAPPTLYFPSFFSLPVVLCLSENRRSTTSTIYFFRRLFCSLLCCAYQIADQPALYIFPSSFLPCLVLCL